MVKPDTIKKQLRRVRDVKNFGVAEKDRDQAYAVEQALSWVLYPKKCMNPSGFFSIK